MRSHFSLVVAVSCVCAMQVAGHSTGLGEFESFPSESPRPLRAVQDIRNVPSNKRVAQAQGPRQPSNIVYGKGRHAEQPKFRPQNAPKPKPTPANNQYKFTASPEDSGYESDGQGAYAQQSQQSQQSQQYKLNPQDTAALQKYMQKYASQLYNAQKHASQLSESQKFVLGQDPYSKKYVLPQQQQHKYQTPKFIPLSTQETRTTATPVFQKFQDDSFESVEPITTERYQNFQVQNKVVVHATKVPKTPPKKAYAYSYDNTPQSTDYKYSNVYGNTLEPQAVNQFLSSYTSQDRDSISSYDHQSLGQFGAGLSDKSELPKITGYKIPGAVSLSLGHSGSSQLSIAEEKGHQEHGISGHDEHHAEPKYEFMYQVKDPEKHNHFGHSEARKGKTTWGRYYVQLPDGRFETVKYWADKSGYHAEVDFKGHAKHPSHSGHHSLGERLEDGGQSEGYGTSYVANNFKGYDKIDEAGLSSHQDYNIAEQGEDYQ